MQARVFDGDRGLAGHQRQDLGVVFGVAAGLLGAVWWGIKHPEHVNRCSTHGPANEAFEHCTSSTIAAVALHWAAIIGGGLAVGVALALALALLTRMLGDRTSPSNR